MIRQLSSRMKDPLAGGRLELSLALDSLSIANSRGGRSIGNLREEGLPQSAAILSTWVSRGLSKDDSAVLTQDRSAG